MGKSSDRSKVHKSAKRPLKPVRAAVAAMATQHSGVPKGESSSVGAAEQRLNKERKRKLLIKNRVLFKQGKIDQHPMLLTKKAARGGSGGSQQLIAHDKAHMFSALEASLAALPADAAAAHQQKQKQNSSVHPAASAVHSSNKLSKAVAVREVERMRLVQASPVYQADPLEALKMHLGSMAQMRLNEKQQQQQEQQEQEAKARQLRAEAEAVASAQSSGIGNGGGGGAGAGNRRRTKKKGGGRDMAMQM